MLLREVGKVRCKDSLEKGVKRLVERCKEIDGPSHGARGGEIWVKWWKERE